jgi:hypothetical protein
MNILIRRTAAALLGAVMLLASASGCGHAPINATDPPANPDTTAQPTETLLPEAEPAVTPSHSPIEYFDYENLGVEIVIMKYTGSEAEVVIPDNIDGFPVKHIMDRAFFGNETLTTVTIPAGVSVLRESVFEQCTALETVILPDNLEYIGAYAFKDCISLENIFIPHRVRTINKSAFTGCISLTSISIPSSVSAMGGSVFSGCSSLRDVTIEEGLRDIIDETFLGCVSLKTITIPRSVQLIKSGAFADTSLESISFAGDAPKLEAAFDARNDVSKTITDIFGDSGKDITIYYNEGTSGWDSPVWSYMNLQKWQ